MLALDALLAGSEEDLVAYIEQAGADLFLAQDGVKNMHMASSAISWRDIRLASHANGVITASPILYTTGVVKVNKVDILSYIIGFDPSEPLGGPRTVVAGTTQLQRDEAIIDDAIARAQGVELGTEVEILGHTFTVAGITRGMTNLVNSITFIRLSDFQKLRAGDAVSYALLTIDPLADATAVASAIMARNDDVTALPRADFAREERQVVKDMSAEILNIMNLAGLLIGLAITALTLYTNTLRKRQEYGVLKAIGATNAHLYTVVVAQAFINVLLGAVGAIALVWLLGQLLSLLMPNLSMILTPASIIRVLISSLLIGIAGALIPAWQLARLDPAQVFRG
jgi:putative ABC transport system permease protein